MSQIVWSADKIRAEIKKGTKPFVVFRENNYRNISQPGAELLDGDYYIEDKPHEVVIHDNYKRRKTG